MDAHDQAESDRYDGIMRQFAEGRVPDDVYAKLAAEASAARKAAKQERRRQSKRPPHAATTKREPSVNVADLKRRIYNPSVSRGNVIKALEALPPRERKAVIAGLPPGLRQKLGDYLHGRGH